MPFDAVGFEFLPKLFAFQNAVWLERFGPLETQQRESNSSARKLAQVRKHLALAKRVKHSIVGDE
jgi:hypothetical protein